MHVMLIGLGGKKVAYVTAQGRDPSVQAAQKTAPAIERDAFAEGANEDGVETVTVQFRGNSIRVPRGTVLRSALLQNGLTPHNGAAQAWNCRGTAHCGTCAVRIEGPGTPEMIGGKEKFRLSTYPHKLGEKGYDRRLACQVRLQGDVKVTKYDGVFGEGSVPKGPTTPSESVAPLGKLEYFFDFERKGEAF